MVGGGRIWECRCRRAGPGGFFAGGESVRLPVWREGEAATGTAGRASEALVTVTMSLSAGRDVC